jgi:drug/metabolite transporter (DMT)-like permease
MLAFAGNSLLCREALAAGEVDAGTFTAVRLASGAAVLALLAAGRQPLRAGSWLSAAALFAYAAPFSYAYLELGAGAGALILFGVVQATMIGWGIARGDRPRPLVWLGLLLALGGLVYLTLPGARAPDPAAAALMALAGVAWGIYSLRGRGAADPLATTAGNFVRSLPLAAALIAIVLATHVSHASPRGHLLAATSGALASGLGYSIWYAALRGLTATRAAIIQLVVPVLAAAGGIALLGEPFTMRLAIAATAIVGGIALALRR